MMSLGILGLMVVTACGGGETTEKEEPKLQLQSANSAKEEPAKEEKATQEASMAENSNEAAEKGNDEAAEAVTIEIEGNDQMRFNKTELTVKEGQEVTINLKHVGKLPIESMGHNWVLLAQGTDIPTFGQAAAGAGIENEHIPSDMSDKIIAHTGLVGGGEETSVTFTAPAAGEYQYICSFPGHYALMKGKLIVE